MRLSILATAIALATQVSWAQETTDPVVPTGDETAAGSQETAPETPATEATETDTAEETSPETQAADEPETVEETEPVVVEVTETETVEANDPEVVEGTDPEVVVTEVSEPEEEVDEEPVTATDNRSSNGQFHGEHGSVSTLARAGLGPVFGKLRSQGYGDIRIEQIGDEITLEAFRDGQMRKLTYNATTGALLSDEQGQPNLIQSIANTFRKDRAGTVKTDKTSKGARSGDSKQASGSNMRGGGLGGSKNTSAGAKSDNDGKGNGGGQGGGNSKGNGSGQGGGKGNGGGQGGGRNR